MGFWLGTFLFILAEVIGFAVVHFTGKRGENLCVLQGLRCTVAGSPALPMPWPRIPR